MKSLSIKSALIAFFILTLFYTSQVSASQTELVGPAGSGTFGDSVTVLPNGNIVVTDPTYSIPGGAASVGAIYLYDGAMLSLISRLTGSMANDAVGYNGVTVLSNGNYVVRSQYWNGNRSAVTFGNALTGISGIVSSGNSLVGSAANDRIGFNGVKALTNGNYVVGSSSWNNYFGAATFGSGTSGVSGIVSSSNSLVGSTTDDQVGSSITPLTNGNYVVGSFNWNGGFGAATFSSGISGISGVISGSNSLVGSNANDLVGLTITALTNGNYVVASPYWNNYFGAATFGSGTSGVSGIVSSGNSLVGSAADDRIGLGITPLTNGNYVVNSPAWNGLRGAVTFGSGTTGVSGIVSSSNSLVGSTANDRVGYSGITPLTNGNYVVGSYVWNGGFGAATFGSGISGITGVVSGGNSLVGSNANDLVGMYVTPLTNGNYVVNNSYWNSKSGAATFGSGTSGISGIVSSNNSLIGSNADDLVGGSGITALTNGNYVVGSNSWNGNRGAATFGSGTTGISGTISGSNSLVGSNANDSVGFNVTALTNGNYVASTQYWNGSFGAATFGSGVSGISGTISGSNSLIGSNADSGVSNGGVTALTNGNYVLHSFNGGRGAVTFGSGATGISGWIAASNSLIGSNTDDNVGGGSITALTNGNYVLSSPTWDNGAINNAGADTFGNGASGTFGAVSSGAGGGNSVVGTTESGINTFAFDPTRNRLFVGRSASNRVSVLFFNTTAVADGSLNNAANFDNGLPGGLVNAIIPNGRTISLSGVSNIGQVSVDCTATLTGASPTNYIVGNVRRNFCAASGASFVYPIGDPNNYSPVTASNVNGTGALTVTVTTQTLPGLPSALSAARFWNLDGAGITTDLTFQYAADDIRSTESSYRVHRRFGTNNISYATTINTTAHTAKVTNISNFSPWGIGNSATVPAPTAAGVSISGKAKTADGRGLMNAFVLLTTQDGRTVSARTSAFGVFRFEGLKAGQTVIVNVQAKRYTFAPQLISLTADLKGLELTANN